MTQQDLADKVNKTRALISYIEKKGKVNQYTLTEILDALGISQHEFDEFDISDKVIHATPSKKHAVSEEIALLKEKVQIYQKENKILKDLAETQKKVIASLSASRSKVK